MTTIEKEECTRCYGYNGYIKHVLLVIIASIMVLSLALVSCKPDSDLGEYSVPANYLTYTDKNGLFSISYPPDWKIKESSLSAWSEESDSLNEYLKGNKYTIDTNYPNAPNIKDEWRLLIASEDNDDKNGFVTVFAKSREEISLKGKTKEQIYNWVLEAKDYKPFLQQTLRIAGNEVAIFNVQPKLEFSDVVSITITDKIVWGVSCRSEIFGNQDDRKDYQIIVRSLHIFK